jgi:mono/diheme cytochrome c family protein
LVLFVIAACGANETSNSVDGKTLYAEHCARCHGPDGRPDAMMVARMGVRDLTSPELRARITPLLVEGQMRQGSKNGLMPSFTGGLRDEQFKAIAEYVAGPTFLPP